MLCVQQGNSDKQIFFVYVILVLILIKIKTFRGKFNAVIKNKSITVNLSKIYLKILKKLNSKDHYCIQKRRKPVCLQLII